ncbi:MAG: F0F1 ATP synthase subunit gamma [Gloeobacterales cyanobacterium]
MPSLEFLQRQISTIQDLQSVVKTMKVLSAASIRQYERAIESLAEYSRTIDLGLQVLLGEYARTGEGNLRTLTSPIHASSKQIGVIIFGSDQGMCGQFNEQISRYAIAQFQTQPLSNQTPVIVVVGARVMTAIATAEYPVETSFSMPTSLSGITPIVQELLLLIESWQMQQRLDQVILLYNQLQSNAAVTPHTLHLLPIDLTWLQQFQTLAWQSQTVPMFTMDWRPLFSALIRQYLFISLYRALVESLASETFSRLTSMQLAEQNINNRLVELNTQFQHQRQTSITEEILEIVSGFEVLSQQLGDSGVTE